MLLVLVALAQTAPAPETPKPLLLDFEGAEVNAHAAKPDIVYAFEPAPPGHNPLIQVRANFDPEMLRSVDETR